MSSTLSDSPASAKQESKKFWPNIKQLTEMAARGLGPMFDEKSQLFCYRLLRTERGVVREGLSPRYTIMTLLGLREYQSAGGTAMFDTEAIYRSFVSDPKWISSAGDLGLFLWLVGSFDPGELPAVSRQFDLQGSLTHYSDARQGRSMELAWLLAGLASAAAASPSFAGEFGELATQTYVRLKENQGENGLFGHMNVRSSLRGRVRGRIGSFADQIYPIYGISKYAKAFQIEDSLDSALRCAMAVCRMQGEFGQWWWLYDSRSGRLSSHYPVYSVHQHGMAPMGLLALEEATGCKFQEAIYKGLQWIYGVNELHVDMRDSREDLIWRCVLPKSKWAKYREMAANAIGRDLEPPSGEAFEILYEDRPYELGWLLFAFSKIATQSNHAPSAGPSRLI